MNRYCTVECCLRNSALIGKSLNRSELSGCITSALKLMEQYRIHIYSKHPPHTQSKTKTRKKKTYQTNITTHCYRYIHTNNHNNTHTHTNTQHNEYLNASSSTNMGFQTYIQLSYYSVLHALQIVHLFSGLSQTHMYNTKYTLSVQIHLFYFIKRIRFDCIHFITTNHIFGFVFSITISESIACA